ncbi:MAG: YdcF family protein [Proteobacteria bacterium]|nr:YdcF family protein [Pseudomonadota bacterium]
MILKFLSHLVLPPASMALGFTVGAVLAFVGLRRLGLALALLSAFETLILSVPLVSRTLVAPLERYAREEAAQAAPCCYPAIVVLGGGWNDLRILHAAHLYKRGVAPRIIVSGGDLAADPAAARPEAEDMKRLLVLVGVPADSITTEDASRNTAENIANVREIVGDQPVALVTSAYHMKRALNLARRARLDAYAFPTDFAPRLASRPVWDEWLPNVSDLQLSAASLWEYLGITFDFRAVEPTPTFHSGSPSSASSSGAQASPLH